MSNVVELSQHRNRKRTPLRMMTVAEIRLRYNLRPIVGALLARPSFPAVAAITAHNHPLFLESEVVSFFAENREAIREFQSE